MKYAFTIELSMQIDNGYGEQDADVQADCIANIDHDDEILSVEICEAHAFFIDQDGGPNGEAPIEESKYLSEIESYALEYAQKYILKSDIKEARQSMHSNEEY